MDESVSINAYANTCRACMIYNSKNEMIFLYETTNIGEVFSKCTSLEATEFDGLPAHICKDCHNQLISYYNFRLLCTSSDNYFRQKLEVKVENNANKYISEFNAESENWTVDNSIEDIGKRKKDREKPDDTENKIFKLDIPLLNKNVESEKNDLVTVGDHFDIASAEECFESTNDSDDDDNDDETLQEYLARTEEQILEDDTNVSNKSKNNLTCSICNKKFFKIHRLEGHLRQHQGLKPCVCKICGKEFSKWSGLSIHINCSHSENKRDKKYICEFEDCNRSYNMKQSLNSHKKKMHSNSLNIKSDINFICELCGKLFKTNCALKKHTYVHTGLMPYSCTVCPKKYATKHKLKEHLMRHEGVKNHICPFCGLRKTTPHELKVHINYHTREKLYPCKLCSAVFTSIGNMSRHVKIVHCGIKAFNCTFCERSFGKSETLKHHIMTHTGERPHACSMCGKRFIQAIALQTHMKTHTKVL